MDATALRQQFAQARVARLGTITPDGRPHLVPIVFALRGDTVYSAVDAKPKRTAELARLTNVAAQPRASVLADHYEEDWSALWWVRGDGRGRVLEPDLAARRPLPTAAGHRRGAGARRRALERLGRRGRQSVSVSR
jgi:PPOX class probable F420-dependent enzyme